MKKYQVLDKPLFWKLLANIFILIVYLGFPSFLRGASGPGEENILRDNPPIIQVTPTHLTDSLYVGDLSVLQFTIRNIQTAPSQLYYSIQENPAVDWLSVTPDSGWLTSTQSQVVDVNLDATLLTNGIYTCQLNVISNDTLNPNIQVNVILSVFWPTPFPVWPDSLYFTLPQNAQDSAGFTVKNGSLDSTIILSLSTAIYSDTIHWLSVKPTAAVVSPLGQVQCQALVNSTGLFPGNHSGSIVIYFNDPVNPEIRLPRVSLLVRNPPVMQLSLDTLCFDTVIYVGNYDKMFWVRNLGAQPLQIDSITSNNTNFTAHAAQNIVPSMDSVEVTVTFAPFSPGTHTGWIFVSSNDPITPVDSVFVYGVAIDPGEITIIPNFTNPIIVYQDDSVDFTITISNNTPFYFPWSGFVGDTPFFVPVKKKSSRKIVEKTAYSNSLFDIQFSFPLTGAGHYGAEFDGTYFYVTLPYCGQIWRYDAGGALVEVFSIPGVSGLKDLAFDGTYMYGGNSANIIYEMDFDSKTLVSTITSPVTVTHIAYDESYDAFWVGGWNTDLVLLDRAGTVLSTIPIGSAGINLITGTAYDHWSDGGPYLWVFGEPPGGGTPTYVSQIDLQTGTFTGVTHNVAADFPVASPSGGGLFAADGFVNNKATLGGVLRGSLETFFCYELAPSQIPWLKLLVDHGTVPPYSTFDILLRAYGWPGNDSLFVVILSNEPGFPPFNILITHSIVLKIENQIPAIPQTYAISQNYPNPFNPTTSIDYQIPKAGQITLDIYDILGQRVRRLMDGWHESGYYSAEWDGRDDAGLPVASGIYIYRFRAGEYQAARKMILLR